MQNPSSSIPSSQPPVGNSSAKGSSPASGQHLAARLAHQIHSGFTRDNIISNLKTLGWVIPLTILIWIYAEREQVATESNVTFPVAVKSPDPTRFVVTLKFPRDKNVVAELSGPRKQLDRVRDELGPRGDNTPPILIDLDPRLPPGDHVINAAANLANQPVFVEQGITVRKCTPETFIVSIDRLEQRDAEVRLPADVRDLLTNVTFEPKKVPVRGPQFDLIKAENIDKLHVLAEIPPEILKSPGHHDLPAAPLSKPSSMAGDTLTIAASTVRISFDVKQADSTWKIPSMPVFIVSPPGLLDKYRVIYPPSGPTVANVIVTGPPKQIELLQTNAYPAKAILELSSKDKDDHSPRQLKYDLPEDVKVSAEDAQRTFDAKLVERTNPE